MVERRNIEKLYNIMKVGDLHENFTGVGMYYSNMFCFVDFIEVQIP